MFMIGNYEIDKSRRNEPKIFGLKRTLLIVFCIYLSFILIVLIGNEPDKLFLVGVISVSIWIPSLIAIVISLNMNVSL